MHLMQILLLIVLRGFLNTYGVNNKSLKDTR